jgi:hypothetical protein
MPKIALVYHFYEASDDHLQNLKYFLKHGISDEIHYYFMFASSPKIHMPQSTNITVTNIENKNRDIGGYTIGQHLAQEAVYEYTFFMNSGMGGPFLYENQNLPWFEYFIQKLNSNTKLIGTSINKLQRPVHWCAELESVLSTCKFSNFIDRRYATHVQTGFFCMDWQALEYLRSIDFFNQDFAGTYW